MGENNTWLNRFMTKNMSSAEIVDLSLGQSSPGFRHSMTLPNKLRGNLVQFKPLE